MNIFAKITGRTMRRNKARTVVTVIGVILATAMITAILVLGISVQKFMLQHAVEQDGYWHIFEQVASEKDAESLTKNPEVKEYSVVRELGYGDTSFLKTNDEANYWYLDYIYMQAIDRKAAEMLSIKVSEGRLPENENEIILQGQILRKYDSLGNLIKEYKVGDRITFTVGDRMQDGEKLYGNPWGKEGENGETFAPRYERTYTIVGVLSSWGNTNTGGGGSDAFTGEVKDPKHREEDKDASWSVYAKLKNPYHINEVFRKIQRDGVNKMMFGTNESVLKWMGASVNRAFNVLLGGVFGILITIVAAGAVSLIYNAFAISLRERTTQFGILASVGATNKQIKKSMLYEALTAGIIGIPVGMLSGIMGIGITLHYIGPWIAAWIHGMGGNIELCVSPAAVLGTAVIVAVILGISAWIPVKRIRCISPLDAIRATRDIHIHAGQVKTPAWALRCFGMEGVLAGKNYRRDRKKHKTTVIALVISMLLFTSSSLLSEYLLGTGTGVMRVPEYEIEYSIPHLGSKETGQEAKKSQPEAVVRKEISDAGEVERIQYCKLQTARLADEELVTVIGIPDKEYENYAKADEILYYDRITEYLPETGQYVTRFLLGSGEQQNLTLIWKKCFMDEEGETRTEEIMRKDIHLDRRSESDKIAFARGYLSGVTILIPMSRMEEFVCPEIGIEENYAVKTKEYNQMEEKLNQKIEDGTLEDGYVYNAGGDYERQRGIMIAIKVLTYGFTVLMSLIAAANVFNTISTNVLLRKREFAMLSSIGMSRKMRRKMLRYECMIYMLKAFVYGVIGTFLIDVLMFLRIGRSAMVMKFIVPWQQSLVVIVWMVIVVYVTMSYTERRLKDDNLMEELKKE